MQTKPTKAASLARVQSLIAGVTKHVSVPTVIIAGKSYTPAEVVSALQVIVSLSQAASVAKGGWLAALKAENDGWSGAKVFVSGIRQLAMTMYSSAPDVLNDFGIVPRKRAVTTVADKAQAVVKRKATQVARGTVLSKKAKAKIKGTTTVAPKIGA